MGASVDTVASPGVDTSATAHPQAEGRDLWFGLGVGAGLTDLQELLGLQEVSATIGGFADASHAIQFNVSYMHTPLAHTSEPEYPIARGISLAEFQADFRFYTPARYSFLNHYFSVGAGVAIAFWDYGDQTTFARSGTNSSDYLLGYDVHAGTGFVLGQFWPLGLNLDITPGVVFWSSGTDQGYSRAILPTFVYFKVRVHFSFFVTGP